MHLKHVSQVPALAAVSFVCCDCEEFNFYKQWEVIRQWKVTRDNSG
jgi:hypothetical protein